VTHRRVVQREGVDHGRTIRRPRRTKRKGGGLLNSLSEGKEKEGGKEKGKHIDPKTELRGKPPTIFSDKS